MKSNVKVLGLALMAVLAMSAFMAASASAEAPFEFHSETSPTTLTGVQEGSDTFITDGGTITCTSATYDGTVNANTTSSISVKPTYSGCTAFGFINVPIHTNGCEYQFTTGTRVSTTYHGSIHIVCPTKAIEVTAPGCTVTVGTQTPTGGTITYTNIGVSGSTREVTIDVNLSGIHYTEHNTGGGCVGPTGTTKTNGTYHGKATVTGENPTTSAHHGIWVA